MPVPLPTLDVQRRLVARIDALFCELDDGETALARARADLETYRKSLLKAAVAGALTADWRAANASRSDGAELLARVLADRRNRWRADPRNYGKRYIEPAGPDVARLERLPDGWTWATLGQLTFVSGGATVDAKRKALSPITVPYLRVANVQRGWLDLEKVKTIELERSAVPPLRLLPGDVLLNEGGDRDKVGRGWVFEGQISDCVHQNHVFKARPASDVVLPKLVSSYLNEFGRAFFMEQGKQTTNLASISLSKVSKAPVPVPPLAEAEVIWTRLEDSQHDISSELEADASALRQSILAAAFRGELT